MTPTTEQRRAYQHALEGKGVPALYAFMASELLDDGGMNLGWGADYLICCGFVWSDTTQWQGFWEAIELECRND